ncbi:MAG TPA: AbrB/MazE/SpoVT family DNA-binding domain-containing protein [Bryobacteraceae bacterium]
MAKVTSKHQVTVPKKIADQYNIRPGDDIEWLPAGDSIRVVPRAHQTSPDDRETRLRLFDESTERIRKRALAHPARQPRARGWKREDVYVRGRAR